MVIANLFAQLPKDSGAEVFEALLERPGFRLERIVSMGQATPPGEWLQQEDHEWVLLLSGGAAIRFEGESDPRELKPGDHLLIESFCRHRVEWTATNEATIWLALHFGADKP